MDGSLPFSQSNASILGNSYLIMAHFLFSEMLAELGYRSLDKKIVNYVSHLKNCSLVVDFASEYVDWFCSFQKNGRESGTSTQDGLGISEHEGRHLDSVIAAPRNVSTQQMF